MKEAYCFIRNKYYYFFSIVSTMGVILSLGIKTSNIIALLLFVGFVFFFSKTPVEWQKADKALKICLSLLFAVFNVLGNYEAIQGSSESMADSVLFIVSLAVSIIGWIIVYYYILTMIFSFLLEKRIQLVDRKGCDNKLFLKVFIVFLLCWLPYFIIYLPGIMSPDTVIQFMQILGQRPYNNHHPVVHTGFMHLTFALG